MPDHPTGAASDPTDISSAISALERAIIASEKRADHAENRANLAGIRAEQAESRADALRERVEGLLTQLATAEAGASASREQLAAAERRADTERERADRAEAAAAHERQDFLDVEVLTRRELDTLRERLAEAEKGREAAEAAVLQAAQTADEALQIAAARQRLGLVARLRAAWRGK